MLKMNSVQAFKQKILMKVVQNGAKCRFLHSKSIPLSPLSALNRQQQEYKDEIGTENISKLNGNELELKLNNWENGLKFHLEWLRDNCQCEQCRQSGSGLRIGTLYGHIGLRNISLENDKIVLTWFDGHETTYNPNWLWQNSSPPEVPTLNQNKTLWNSAKAQTVDFARVKYGDLIASEATVRHFLQSILQYGVAFVDEVPPTKDDTRLVMERFGPIWRTFWGEIYHVVADLTKHNHPSYTGGTLELHTDTNYYFEGAGLQAFHVLEHTGTGGANKLVDGFHVAETIRLHHPNVYNYLSTKPISFKYKADGFHLTNEDILFKHHPATKELVQIRYTPYDLDTFRTVDQQVEVESHYNALTVLKKELNNPANAHWLQLQPGTVLVTDNWRVLHGRASFTGKRKLCGMYVGRSNFLSRARKLGMIQ